MPPGGIATPSDKTLIHQTNSALLNRISGDNKTKSYFPQLSLYTNTKI